MQIEEFQHTLSQPAGIFENNIDSFDDFEKNKFR